MLTIRFLGLSGKRGSNSRPSAWEARLKINIYLIINNMKMLKLMGTTRVQHRLIAWLIDTPILTPVHTCHFCPVAQEILSL